MAESLKISKYGEGEVLVFLHGWGLNSAVWQAVVDNLSKNYQVITIDLPGFGKNVNVVPQHYNIKSVAKLVAEVIPEASTLVGWSLGGLVATQIALSHSSKVNKLVTVASSPCFVEQEGWPGIKPNVLNGFHRMLSEDSGKTINDFLKIQAMGSPNLRQDIKVIKKLINQYPNPDESALTSSLSILENVNLKKSLSNIQIPFLRLYGKLDTLVPKVIINKVSELSEKSEVYIFDKSSHAPFISQELEFINTLTHWLER